MSVMAGDALEGKTRLFDPALGGGDAETQKAWWVILQAHSLDTD